MPYASPTIRDIYGVGPEDVAEDFAPVLARVHPDDAPRVKASVLASAQGMTQWRDEWRFKHPVKGWRWIEGCSMPVREADGGILWHGYIQDITERKQGEARLAELNTLLHLVMDAVPALIAYVGADLRYKIVNRSYERWFGAAARGIVGREVGELLGPAAWQTVRPWITRALAGEPVEFEAELPYKIGGARWVRAAYLPDTDERGNVRGVVVMVQDTTLHRLAETELRRSRQKFVDLMARQDGLIEAERRHMAREIHDELGQLLTGMRLALSALDMKGSGARRAEATHTARQLEGLVEEASGVVRRISGNLRPVLLEHGLLPALEGLATDFRSRSRIACRLTVSGEPHTVTDQGATAVFRIVQESLTNIARHAQAQSASIHLSFDAGQLRLIVQDDGCGFDTTAALDSSRSLGLFGMQERAAIAGGSLRIVSASGRGTRLEAAIPLDMKVSP